MARFVSFSGCVDLSEDRKKSASTDHSLLIPSAPARFAVQSVIDAGRVGRGAHWRGVATNSMFKKNLVPTARLELAQLSPLPPQDSVSTNFTTSA
jgi:hypothetical protein